MTPAAIEARARAEVEAMTPEQRAAFVRGLTLAARRMAQALEDFTRAIVRAFGVLRENLAKLFGVPVEELPTTARGIARLRRRAGIPGRHGRRRTARERKRSEVRRIQAARRGRPTIAAAIALTRKR